MSPSAGAAQPSAGELLQLWPTPLGRHRYAAAAEINPLLVRMFSALRASDAAADAGAAFYASAEDLLQRIRLPEWQALVGFFVQSLRDTVAGANAAVWPEGAPGLRLAINAMWFQISNHGVHHDIHTHGNCSWSAVYCVQVDDEFERSAHPVYGASNGVTRFYGPHFNHLGGAHADFGNAYLQQPHADFVPLPGQLLIVPSWLAHQAMPYAGTRDRIIISFNASVHHDSGSDQLHAFASR